jgi:Holliday junction resolvase-like predicted endonuclease
MSLSETDNSTVHICPLMTNGREWENTVAKYLQDLGFTVETRSIVSGHEIDVLARKNGEKLVVECKDHDSSIGIATIRDTDSKARDIGAVPGIAYTSYLSDKAREKASEWEFEIIPRERIEPRIEYVPWPPIFAVITVDGGHLLRLTLALDDRLVQVNRESTYLLSPGGERLHEFETSDLCDTLRTIEFVNHVHTVHELPLYVDTESWRDQFYGGRFFEIECLLNLESVDQSTLSVIRELATELSILDAERSESNSHTVARGVSSKDLLGGRDWNWRD